MVCCVCYFRAILRLCAFLLHRQFRVFSSRESFSTAHSTANLYFYATLQNFSCRITETNFFADVCHFPVCISFACVQYHRLNACVQLRLQRNYLQLQQKNIVTPRRHHLSSSCCFMLCVSALANLSTPLSRRGAFLYSGNISALMFCAFLLRNSQ